MANFVFVYGTLRKGCRNNLFFQGFSENESAVFIGMAKTVEKYGFFVEPSYGIPYAVKRKDGKTVNIIGEVYRVNDALLRRLDLLEGHPGHYKRSLVQVDVFEENGKARKLVWMYLYPEENIYPRWRFIESGDYKNFK